MFIARGKRLVLLFAISLERKLVHCKMEHGLLKKYYGYRK